MDFKQRFQGKTSHITKEGAIDHVISTSNVPINKVERITINNPQGPNQLISFNSTSSQSKETSSKVGNGFGGENYNLNNELSSPTKINSINDLEKDNIYLRGGGTMAEAMKTGLSHKPGVPDTQSIAMRMKRNRESLMGNTVQPIVANAPMNIGNAQPKEDEKLYQANPFPGLQNQTQQSDQQFWKAAQTTTYSDNSVVTNNQSQSNNPTPGQSQNSRRQGGGADSISQKSTTSINSQGGQQKHQNPVQLRQSVEQQRHNNLTQISKQIVQTNNKILAQDPKNAYQTQDSISQMKRINSYVGGDQSPNMQESSKIGGAKQRAISVNNGSSPTKPIVPLAQQQLYDNIQSQQQLAYQSQQQQNLQKRPGAYRSAGQRKPADGDVKFITDQRSQRVQEQFQTQFTSSGTKPFNTAQPGGPSSQYQSQTPLIQANSLTPEQIQQQILLMQHQMMLLSQQQQLIQMGHIVQLPNTSPLIQGNGLQNPPMIGGLVPGVQPGYNDVYKQFEIADQKYQNQARGSKKTSTSYSQNNAISAERATGYKPYTLKDFNQMVSTQQNLKLGGLGPNIGNDDWEKARQKKEQAQEYARQIKMQNMQKPPSKKNDKVNYQKEKSSRDKAIEFAKHIPKPKPRQLNSDGTEDQYGDDLNYNDENSDQVFNINGYNQQKVNEDLVNIEEEPFDEYGNTIHGNELLELNNKHKKQYGDEIE